MHCTNVFIKFLIAIFDFVSIFPSRAAPAHAPGWGLLRFCPRPEWSSRRNRCHIKKRRKKNNKSTFWRFLSRSKARGSDRNLKCVDFLGKKKINLKRRVFYLVSTVKHLLYLLSNLFIILKIHNLQMNFVNE